jgi:uncharacterized protein YggE
MRLLKFILFTTLLITLCACASTSITDNKVITAYGIGRVTFVPDIINSRITINNTDDNLLTAVSRTEETIIEFLFVCRKFNILDENIHRTNIITIKHDIYNSRTNRMDLVQYESINVMQISIKNLSIFKEFSEEILQLAGLAIDGFFFTHSNIVQYEVDASLLALDDARSKAEKITEHIGFSLGEIVDILYFENRDLDKNWYSDIQGFYWSAVATSVLPAIITLSQKIQVKYSIKY